MRREDYSVVHIIFFHSAEAVKGLMKMKTVWDLVESISRVVGINYPEDVVGSPV